MSRRAFPEYGSGGAFERVTPPLTELEMGMEAEGLKPGTPEYERVLRYRKMEKCREMKGFSACSECPAATDCTVRLAFLRDVVNRDQK